MKFSILTSIVAFAIVESASAKPSKSITFSGGGFRAHAVGSGVMAGMLSVAAKNQSGNSFHDLMQNFENIGSNSGGTWFTTQFIYSENFKQLLEDIASASGNHDRTVSLYARRWVDQLLFATNMSRSDIQVPSDNDALAASIDIIEQILKLLGDFASWASLFLNYFMAKDVSWRHFVTSIMRVPGDLDPHMSLADAPSNPWALGKRYVVAGAVVEPKVSSRFKSTSGAFERTCVDDTGSKVVRSMSYEPQYHSAGKSTPITFSTYLNNKPSVGTQSPFPFYHGEVITHWPMNYYVQDKSTWYNFGDVIETITEHRLATGPGMYSNQISIGDVAATSSAFLSQVISIYDALGRIGLALKSMGLYDFLLRFMMPAAMNPGVQPISIFDKAIQHAKPEDNKACGEWFNDIIEDNIMTLTDGGYVDNTAVSNILSEAKDGDEFTLVLNSRDLIVDDIKLLFQGDAPVGQFLTHVPVFQEGQDYAVQVQRRLRRLNVYRGAKVLKDISYGSFQAVTAPQPHYGVQSGKKVTINVILVSSKMEIVPMSWTEPSSLVGDIVSTLNADNNRDAAQYILHKFF